MVIKKLAGQFPGLRLICADGGYAGKLVNWAREEAGYALEIARRPKGERGFTLLPKRWVVERTLAWLNKYRRISNDCERQVETSEAWIRIVMINLTLRRLAA